MTFDDRIENHMRAFLADPASAAAWLEGAKVADLQDEDSMARACAALFLDMSAKAVESPDDVEGRNVMAATMTQVYALGNLASLMLKASRP